jgi:hypothetical protein
MFLAARYSSFHVVGIPLSPEYAVARTRSADGWRGRLTSRDVSLHAARSGDHVTWPHGATCLYINFRAGFISARAGSSVTIETHHARPDRVGRR